MLLTLDERDQSLVHRLLAATPEPGYELLPPDVAGMLVRLACCDSLEVEELDRAGRRLRGFARPDRSQRRARRDGDTVRLSFLTSVGTTVVVTFERYRGRFTDRDVAVLLMVQPVVAALVRGRARLGTGDLLSGSERRVLELVAAGASNRDVAERLYVSVATVRKHLEHAYRKLGVTNRTAAVAALREPPLPVLSSQGKGSRIG